MNKLMIIFERSPKYDLPIFNPYSPGSVLNLTHPYKNMINAVISGLFFFIDGWFLKLDTLTYPYGISFLFMMKKS